MSDRRESERLTVSELLWLRRARLKYGPAVSVIDLSRGGTQIETTSHRLRPGTIVVVQIEGPEGEFAIPARVLRCEIAGLIPSATYRGALVFKQPFELPTAADAGSADGDANLIHEHARPSRALRRFGEAHAANSMNPRLAFTGVGGASLAATLAMIESPSGRRAGEPFTRELSRLFRATTQWIEGGAAPDVLITEISEMLRRSVPTRSVRLISGAVPPSTQSADAVYFDVPAAENQSAARLLIEFPRRCQLEGWHLQLLKTAAQLISLIREVEQLRRPAEQRAGADVVCPAPLGWNRLVVRYVDGRLLKGYGHDFMPARGYVHVWVEPEGPLESRITVPIRLLKALFFVHDFNGNAVGNVGPSSELSPNNGRRIVVTFLDGEVLNATTLNYTSEGPGFFVTPLEGKTNNQRIFVVHEAIRHVRFP